MVLSDAEPYGSRNPDGNPIDEAEVSKAYQRPDGIWVFPRNEFCTKRFVYKAGQHVVYAGPTQRGKTTLAFKCLEPVATPSLPAYVIVSKPMDPVTRRECERLGYEEHSSWPPKAKVSDIWADKPSGFVIWPKFGDVNSDVERAADVSRAVINDRYAQGVKGKKGILVLDDTVVKSMVLKIDTEMTTIITMAGAMGLGAWVFVQKPTGAGKTALWSYGACEHAFLFNDPDKRNRQRYDEIGGFDPHLVEKVTLSLSPYQCLYLKRTGGHMCIVDSK